MRWLLAVLVLVTLAGCASGDPFSGTWGFSDGPSTGEGFVIARSSNDYILAVVTESHTGSTWHLSRSGDQLRATYHMLQDPIDTPDQVIKIVIAYQPKTGHVVWEESGARLEFRKISDETAFPSPLPGSSATPSTPGPAPSSSAWFPVASFPRLHCGQGTITTPLFRLPGGPVRVSGLVHPSGDQEEMMVSLVPEHATSDQDWIDCRRLWMSGSRHKTFAFVGVIDQPVPAGLYRLALYTENASLSVNVYEGE
jgi:hypothetical protein